MKPKLTGKDFRSLECSCEEKSPSFLAVIHRPARKLLQCQVRELALENTRKQGKRFCREIKSVKNDLRIEGVVRQDEPESMNMTNDSL